MSSTIAKVLATSKAFATVSKGAQQIEVAYVSQTDIWTRTFLAQREQDDFKAAVERNINSLKSETTTIALQYVLMLILNTFVLTQFRETPHSSARDERTHFTGVELDASKKVIGKKHFAVE